MEMTIMSVLLLAVLFIAGLVNIFIYFPSCNKFHAWIRSLLFTKPATPRAIDSDGFAAKPPKASSAVQSEKKTEQLKRIFAGFDKNGDGSITKEEIQDSLQNLGLLATEKEVEEMVAKVDSNGDGLIDFDEFCMLYRDVVGGKTKHDEDKNYGDDDDDEDGVLREAFEVFDKDKDGLISVEELGSVLSSLGLNEGKKMENCREMIKKVDKDGDGMVDFSEFKKMMKVGGILV